MSNDSYDSNSQKISRYCKQVVLKAMDRVRSNMRGSDRLRFGSVVENVNTEKDAENLTKGIDQETEQLIIDSIKKKFSKLRDVNRFTIFSEELGVSHYCKNEEEAESKSDLVIFIDPIDGTEFIESLQGGWCLLAVYSLRERRVIAAVAGDIFLNRLYWASEGEPAECLDFVTHSWFKLDGGPNPSKTVAGSRVNFLTTKVERYLAVAGKEKLLNAIRKDGGRINLAWGSNMLIQVAAGYADAAVEFLKGFAAYDILPGLYLAERAGLTVLDLDGNPVRSDQLDVPEILAAYEKDSQSPLRTRFVAAKRPELAEEIVELLR
ncbi:MAG: myo-inositol-1(or 4)-monophosphatase [Verrucomicrobiales bacterium]|jgi:myo-inositol-1(or 4)-monophosphatase